MAEAVEKLLLEELKKQTVESEKMNRLFREFREDAAKALTRPASADAADKANLGAALPLPTASAAKANLGGFRQSQKAEGSFDATLSDKDVIPAKTGGGLGGAVGGIASAFSSVTGAVGAVTGALQAAVGQVVKFTQALSPASVEAFNLAVRDLQATIGVALQPMMQTFTALTRSIAAVLLPVMERLKPIVEKVGGVLLSLANNQLAAFSSVMQSLVPIVEVITDVLTATAPIYQAIIGVVAQLAAGVLQVVGIFLKFNPLIQMATGILTALAPALTALQAVVAGLASAVAAVVESFFKSIGAMLGLNLGDTFKTLKGIVEQLSKAMLLLAANVLKFFSQTAGDAFIKGAIGALGGGERKRAEGLGAAINPSIGGIDSIVSETMKKALLAGGGPTPEDEQKAWRESTIAELKKLQQGQETMLGKWWDDIKDRLKVLLVEAIREASRAPFDAVGSTVRDSIKNNGAAAGAIAGGTTGGVPGAILGAAGGFFFGGR